jgi:hypothetical protein
MDAETEDANVTTSRPASAAVFPLTDRTGDSALSSSAAAANVAAEAAGIVLSPNR